MSKFKDSISDTFTIPGHQVQKFCMIVRMESAIAELVYLESRLSEEILAGSADSARTLKQIRLKIKSFTSVPELKDAIEELDIMPDLAEPPKVKKEISLEKKKKNYFGDATEDEISEKSEKPTRSVSQIMSLARLSKKELKQYWIDAEMRSIKESQENSHNEEKEN